MGEIGVSTVSIGTPIGRSGLMTGPKQLTIGWSAQASTPLMVMKLSITMGPVPSSVEEITAVSPGARLRITDLAGVNGTAWSGDVNGPVANVGVAPNSLMLVVGVGVGVALGLGVGVVCCPNTKFPEPLAMKPAINITTDTKLVEFRSDSLVLLRGVVEYIWSFFLL